MSDALTMLEAYPGQTVASPTTLATCIDACFGCAQVCAACADACLAEDGGLDLAICIRRDLDCAAQCLATGQTVTRQTAADIQALRASLMACVDACGRCAEACERHAAHGLAHCATCADACRRCERACSALIAELLA